MNHDNQTQQYQQMKQIVAKVMEEDPSQWQRLAVEACGGDPKLELMVLDVLQQMQEDTNILEPVKRHQKITQIGPYRMLKTLGEGGMGVVYLAERKDAFQQKVAIKCLRPGLVNDVDLSRFHMERQILARLNHPHIASILDGGFTPEGMPYFVMEYIEGIPLTQYANKHGLDLKARLKLIQQVCSAVHYANQNLIIHRDLKPGNILVRQDGTVKLLDFGIAKLLEKNDPYFSEVAAIETRTGMGMMTLQYASPEQYLSQQVSTATDVYALGLMLYELLTGQRAYQLKGLTRLQVSETILEKMPLLPSQLVAANPIPTLVTFGVSAKVLRSKLAGDLDCIVMMALRKEPERRYSSANDLLQDINAYLDGRPVAAHSEKWTYLLSKFVTRNKLLVSFLGVVFASLLTITTLSIRFAKMAQSKNTVIAAERDEAEAISKFLVNLLEGSDPLVQNANPTLKEVLVRAKDQLEEDQTIDPSAKTQLHLSLISVFLSYELNLEAKMLLEEVMASDSDGVSKHKASALKAVLKGNQGHFQEAQSLYDAAIAHLGHEEEFEFTSRLMLLKGIHLLDALKYSEGISYLQKLLDHERDVPVHHQISAWRNMGRGYSEMGQFEQATLAFDKAEALITTNLPPNALAKFDIQLNRILTLAGYGDFEKALAMADEAIPQVTSVLGEDHTLVCGALVAKATCLSGLGRFEEALELRMQALECMKATYGEAHHQVVYLYNEIGVTYSNMGLSQKAEASYRKAILLADEHLRPGHIFQAITRTNLGSALDQAGKPEEALILNREAYEMIKKNPDARNLYGVCALLYGRSLQSSNQPQKALPLYEEALTLALEFPNQNHYIPGLVHYLAATAFEAIPNQAKAVFHYEAALDDFSARLGSDHPNTINVFQKLEAYYLENEQPEKLKALRESKPEE